MPNPGPRTTPTSWLRRWRWKRRVRLGLNPYVSARPIPPEDIERARIMAAERGWKDIPIPGHPSTPQAYSGSLCSRRVHVVASGTIAESDTRRHRCDCGLTMIANGNIEIRFGLLSHLFPNGDKYV